MIHIEHAVKRFGGFAALDGASLSVPAGSVYGLVGPNGAGKSTLIRCLTGIYLQDEGTVTIDGQPVWEDPKVKSRFFYISDDQYFFPNGTPQELMQFYRCLYPAFDETRFYHLLDSFGLKKDRKINTFSKGMKKQVSVICGICAGTDYIFCDETFDGLDPVMRQTVKSLFANDMAERNLTPIIASHNLRELEDICDHVGLLHRGGILLSRELDDMKLNLHKVQCVLQPGMTPEAFAGLDIMKTEQTGSIYTLTVRGEQEEVLARIAVCEPVFYELIPLSLEEIFISETEVAGYDIKALIL